MRTLLRLRLRSSAGPRTLAASLAANGLDRERAESFLGPARRDRRVVGDLVAALAGERPDLLLDAAVAIPRFERPVLLVWGDRCEFFPMTGAQRLAAEFPHATLVTVPGAGTWVPVDDPAAVADAVRAFGQPGRPDYSD